MLQGIASAFPFPVSWLCVLLSSFSGCSSSPSVCSGFASFVLKIGAGVRHPGRDEMAASICAALMEAVRCGLGKEAVETTAFSQTSFQNLPPAKRNARCCCHLCQAPHIPWGHHAWLPLHWHSVVSLSRGDMTLPHALCHLGQVPLPRQLFLSESGSFGEG